MIGNFIGAPIGGVQVQTADNTGFLALTLDAATLSSAASVAIAAQAAITLDAATLSATGTTAITGSAGIALDDAALSATAALAIVGTEGSLLDDATLVATLALDSFGTLDVQLDDASLLATAEHFDGTAAILLDDCRLEASSIFEFINYTVPQSTGKQITTARQLLEPRITSSRARVALITASVPKTANITSARPAQFQITT